MARSVYRNSVGVFALAAATSAQAQQGPSYTIFGTPGLIEMPTAESADPSDIAATFAYSRTVATGRHSPIN
ncbi:hypothetical protein [Yoonia sp. MH D7]